MLLMLHFMVLWNGVGLIDGVMYRVVKLFDKACEMSQEELGKYYLFPVHCQ